MIKEAISKVTKGVSLSVEEAQEVFKEIFEGKATPSQIASLLVGLKMKEEAPSEILGAVKVIREKAKKILKRRDKDEIIFDTCGSGGSGVNKFNISTAVSFVVAAAGIKVAKHGNRAMSSSCGSADCFEALGIKIDAPLSLMEKVIDRVGIGFLYAPLYHPALKEVAQIRREIGVRTIFNILGPLCSPALATHQLLGVHSKRLLSIIGKVLRGIGVKKAFVVWSKDLGDEVSLGGRTEIAYVNNKRINYLSFSPSSFGLKKINIKKLKVRDAKESAKVLKEIFEGKKGACRDIVLANSACCLYLAGKVKSLKEGVKLAAHLIDEGKVREKLEEFRRLTTTF